MWGTNTSGEAKTLIDASLTDLVYGSSVSKLNYWLGTPKLNYSYYAWMVYGVNGGFTNRNVATDDFIRPSPSYKNLKI